MFNNFEKRVNVKSLKIKISLHDLFDTENKGQCCIRKMAQDKKVSRIHGHKMWFDRMAKIHRS